MPITTWREQPTTVELGAWSDASLRVPLQGVKKKFELVLTIAQHDKKKVTCPKCKSRKVEQQFSNFLAVTSSKS